MSSMGASVPADATGYAPRGSDSYLTASRGLMSWLGTLDHKRIGIMYLAGILLFFFVGGLLAVLVRTELTSPGPTIVSPDNYNRLFTLHGAIMVFIVIIPGIPAALGNFVLPIMIGAKDVAFPRLNLASWYMWVCGGLFALASLFFGAVDTGWTFYTPYSTKYAFAGMIPVVAGAFILGFSSIFTGLNFIVTIHKLRRPEMGWFRMPLFLWAIYSTAVIQVLATPVLGITLLLLLVERTLGIGIFSPDLGGDPVLYQHFFWFYSHPAVYIMILPAMGVMSELISTFSHKHIFGYRFIAYSSVALAIFGFLVWGHHLFTSGQSNLVSVLFSALTFSVAIPSAVKVFNWLATMYKGSISLETPMLYALAFVWIFGWGGLTGLFLGTLAVDLHLHDTYFVVAHFHYVMAGTIFVFIGGIHYWWPKITGKMYNEFSGRLGAILFFVGFNITFGTQFILGSRGMPRRYYDYKDLLPYHPEFHTLHIISSIGSYVMLAGLLCTAACLIHSLMRGRAAPHNPWGSNSLEWHTASPPPVENFHGTPIAGDPYDYENLEYSEKVGGYVVRSTREAVVAHH
jgi:cytochrome c oxidase subunit 1